MPVVINQLSDAQLRAVRGTMQHEIQSLLVRVDDTRKTATFEMDNPMEWMRTKIETYDRERASHRVMMILLRKVQKAQMEKP